LTPPDVSVIIPCFNCASQIRLTLSALANQTVPSDRFEVIVADDGSTDDSLSAVQEASGPISLRLLQQENRGPGATRNQGAREAAGGILVFLDADMIACPELLEEYRRILIRRTEVIVVGRQLPWPEAFDSPFGRVLNYVSARDPGPESMEPEWYYLASGNFAVSRSGFERLEGFDERFRMTEDVDLAYRAFNRDIKLVYAPRAVAYHNHPKTFDQLCSRTYESAWWTAQLMAKHPTMRGEVPVYRDMDPVQLSDDDWDLVLRKIARRALAVPLLLRSMRIAAEFLEQSAPHPPLQRTLYWKILNCYRLMGFRDGANAPGERPGSCQMDSRVIS